MPRAFRHRTAVASCLAVALLCACGAKVEPESPRRPTVADVPGASDYEKPGSRADADAAAAREPQTSDEAADSAAPRPGLRDYRAAGRAVDARDLERAIALLERAVALDPEFAEAWYQLGAARTNLAVERVEVDEAASVRLFRDAVDAKRRASSLMLLGKATLWNANELAQAQSDVDEALRDVNDVLVDDAHVAAALRLFRGVAGS